jgi:hypothetical protein
MLWEYGTAAAPVPFQAITVSLCIPGCRFCTSLEDSLYGEVMVLSFPSSKYHSKLLKLEELLTLNWREPPFLLIVGIPLEETLAGLEGIPPKVIRIEAGSILGLVPGFFALLNVAVAVARSFTAWST